MWKRRRRKKCGARITGRKHKIEKEEKFSRSRGGQEETGIEKVELRVMKTKWIELVKNRGERR